MVVAFFVWMWGYAMVAGFALARSHSAGGGEVGWDLVTIVHNSHRTAELVAFASFALRFELGYRSFARLQSRP
jgi:hypothetical protein